MKRDKKSNSLVLINELFQERIILVDHKGKLVHFTENDINFERVNLLENSFNAEKLVAPYGFYVDPFYNNIALVSWTLYPDGRYFADEDGFGAEDNNETTVYGYMNSHGKMLIPFQDMTEEERVLLRQKAEKMMAEME